MFRAANPAGGFVVMESLLAAAERQLVTGTGGAMLTPNPSDEQLVGQARALENGLVASAGGLRVALGGERAALVAQVGALAGDGGLSVGSGGG